MTRSLEIVFWALVIGLIVEYDEVSAFLRPKIFKPFGVVRGPLGVPRPLARPGLPWLMASNPNAHDDEAAEQVLEEVVHSPDHVEDILIPELLPSVIGFYNEDGTIQKFFQVEKIPEKTQMRIPAKIPMKVPEKIPEKIPEKTPEKIPEKTQEKTSEEKTSKEKTSKEKTLDKSSEEEKPKKSRRKRNLDIPFGHLIDSFEGIDNGYLAQFNPCGEIYQSGEAVEPRRAAREVPKMPYRMRQGTLRNSPPYHLKPLDKRQLFGSENPLLQLGPNPSENLVQSSRRTIQQLRTGITEAIRRLTNRPAEPAPPPPPAAAPTASASEAVANIRQEIMRGRPGSGPESRRNRRPNRIPRRREELVGAALEESDDSLCTCDRCIPLPRARRRTGATRSGPEERERRGPRRMRNRRPGSISESSNDAPVVAPDAAAEPTVGAAAPVVAPPSSYSAPPSAVIVENLVGAWRSFSNSLAKGASGAASSGSAVVAPGSEPIVGATAPGGMAAPEGTEQFPMAKIVGSMTHDFMDGFRTQWESSRKPESKRRQNNSRLTKAVQSGISKSMSSTKKS